MQDKFTVLRNAERFICSGQYKRAISEYEQLLKTAGTDPGVLNTLGDLQLRNGQRMAALKAFKQVAESYLESGFTAKAAGVLRKVNQLDPADLEALQTLADLCRRRGQVSECAAYLEGLFTEYHKAGQTALAVSVQEDLLSLRPSNPQYHLDMASILHESGQQAPAVGQLLHAARLFYAKRQVSEAERAVRRALELAPSSTEASQLLEQISSGQPPEVEPVAPEGTETAGVSTPLAPTEPVEDVEDILDFHSPEGPDPEAAVPAMGSDLGLEELVGIGEESEVPAEPALPPTAAAAELDLDFGFAPQAAVATEAEEAEPVEEAVTPPVAGTGDDAAVTDQLQEVDFYRKLDLHDEAQKLLSHLLALHPDHPRVREEARAAGLLAPDATEVPSGTAGTTPVQSAEGAVPHAFESDMESALARLFKSSEEDEADLLAPLQVTTDDAPVRSDARTRYDLGVAYREMGMLEDAVAKFEDAHALAEEQGEAEQAVACCIVLSEIQTQLSDAESALEWSQRGLKSVENAGEEWKALMYHRAAALNLAGRNSESRECFQQILEVDPNYRDVGAEIARLDSTSN